MFRENGESSTVFLVLSLANGDDCLDFWGMLRFCLDLKIFVVRLNVLVVEHDFLASQTTGPPSVVYQFLASTDLIFRVICMFYIYCRLVVNQTW